MKLPSPFTMICAGGFLPLSFLTAQTDVEKPAKMERFKDLSSSWRGEKIDGPPFDASKVGEIGILIGDKKAGRFSLEVDWIAVE